MSVNKKMTDLADAIRAKSGVTEKLSIDRMTTAVNGLFIGVNTSDATAQAKYILEGLTAYAKGEKITGTLPRKNYSQIALTPSKPSILDLEPFYSDSLGIAVAVTSVTVTPGKDTQSIQDPDKFYYAVTVQGDPNLIPENIVKGKTIFGVEGIADIGGNSADVTLGQVNADGNFQALAFSGTEASNSGDPETVEEYYTYNGVLPVPECGSGGGSADYYKCASVDTVNKTWTGYLAVLTDGFYTFEETATAGLTYSAYTPTIGSVYPADMTGVFSPFADPSDYFVLNDDDTLILYYPQSSGGEVVNIGAGAAKLLHTPNINSVTVSDGKMVFDGNGYISFPANTFPEGIFSNGEWTMDIWYDVDWTSRTTQIIFGRGESPRYDIFVYEDGSMLVGGGPTLVNSRTPENRRRFTLEVWDNSGTLTWTSYINGVKQLEGTWGTTNLRTEELWLGGDPASATYRNIIGTIAHFSIRAKADHKGHNFEVTETPYA